MIAESLPGEAEDTQARFIAVRSQGITAAGIYLPNGNSGGDEGMAYKWRWMDRLRAWAAAELDAFTTLAIPEAVTASAPPSGIWRLAPCRPWTRWSTRKAAPAGAHWNIWA